MPIEGPSADAWGAALKAPALVTHQGKLVAFARPESAPTDTLYFRVIDPAAAEGGEAAWNGWYEFRFPEASPPTPGGAPDGSAQAHPELRLAGMDLLTVDSTATKVQPADANFQIVSDDQFLYCFRPSQDGTLYLNRLMLLEQSEQVERKAVTRYALEVAWEVRYQRSGLRDVPAGETDSQSYRDLTGKPFFEPTIELARVTGIIAGAYSVARVPTADPESFAWYVARADATGVQLFSFRQQGTAVTDFSDPPATLPKIEPKLLPGGTPLPPLSGLAPALGFYAEQDGQATATGEPVELQRVGRLMLAIPVSGGGLTAATAIYDFSVAGDGGIPSLPAADQSLVLVDGKIENGAFVPDQTSPSFPTDEQAGSTVRVVEGRNVDSMLLGQVQPYTDLNLRAAEDGLVHLYHGGRKATDQDSTDGWGALVPGMAIASVAQFDPRVSRAVVALPWTFAGATEQPVGSVYFTARQSGPLMAGAKVTIGDVSFGPSGETQPQTDLCEVEVTYPAATGLPSETWTGVPREVGGFAAVLDGGASDDAADPAVAVGARPFFDFAGDLALARIPATPGGAKPVAGSFPPILTFVSSRPTISLQKATVAADGTGKQLELSFADTSGNVLKQIWPGLPATADTYAEILSGAAGSTTYPYQPGAGSTPLFGLATNAFGVQAPLLLYPTGSADVAGLKIAVAQSTTVSGKLDVHLELAGGVTTVTGVPAAVAEFAAKLEADQGFKSLGLRIDRAGVGGAVVTTVKPATAVDLRGGAVLFDLVLPAAAVTGLAPVADSYAGGKLGHTIDPDAGQDPTRLVGFNVTHDALDPTVTAYVGDQSGQAAGVNRRLDERGAAATVPQSGAWMRREPAMQCSFDGANRVTVPVVANGAILPQSARLRPQWDWTLEGWLRPGGGGGQRLVTFHDGITAVPDHAPSLDYAFELGEGSVISFPSYTKSREELDSAYFVSGVAGGVSPLPAGRFTWEAWVQPQAVPAPVTAGTFGGVIEVGNVRSAGAAFAIGVSADRHVVIRTAGVGGQNGQEFKSVDTVAADGSGTGLAQWSHVAVAAVEEGGEWKLRLYIDAVLDSTFSTKELAAGDPEARLTIGSNTVKDVSMFGNLAQLRLWSTARTKAEIRRSAFSGLSGDEPGLLGCWPLAGIEKGAPGEYVENTVKATGISWRAMLVNGRQVASTVDDDVFLSLIGTAGGVASLQAEARLISSRWNHLAVVFNTGGALALNQGPGFEAGECDWMRVSGESLEPVGSFAVDAWIEMPAATATGTIAARWAWDKAAEDQAYRLQVDSHGRPVFTVGVVVDDAGTAKVVPITGPVNVADGVAHHLAAVFTSTPKSSSGAKASYELALWVDGVKVEHKSEEVDANAPRLRSTGIDMLVGRSRLEPPSADQQAIEALEPFRGVIGRMRLWESSPSVEALFPEHYEEVPTFGPAPGLVSVWEFGDQEGITATDSQGGNDGTLTSSRVWSSLRATSTLTFYANGGRVASVNPAARAPKPASASQFRLGAPMETGVAGFSGQLGQISIWSAARSEAEIARQCFVPANGDEPSLVACWDFAGGGIDITHGGNDPSPPIPVSRIAVSAAPVSNEGGTILNDFGGLIGELTESTPGRIAVGSYTDLQQAVDGPPLAVLLREYSPDPMALPGEPLQVGTLDLVYVGQVQTQPTLIGYIEGAPPVPSENLTRPYYTEGWSYASYAGTAKVALVQHEADQVTYRSSSSSAGSLDIHLAQGFFGVKGETGLAFPPATSKLTDTKFLLQGVFEAETKWGAQTDEGVGAGWISGRRDEAALWGDWEPFQKSGDDYLSPLVGRRYQPANLGYAVVESITADLYATVFHNTGVAIGTITVPNLAIPPDRNLIAFPIDPTYTKAGTLDGKVGLAVDPEADLERGSYFRPGEAYATAAAIEAAEQRDRSYASQFDWEAGKKAEAADLSSAGERLPFEFEKAKEPEVGEWAPTVLTQGIANRYVWNATGGTHTETHGFVATATSTHVGFHERILGGGIHMEDVFYLPVGLEGSLDLLARHTLTIETRLDQSQEGGVELDVELEGEPYLHRWDPEDEGPYGGVGSFDPEISPGKVIAYRFFSFFLPSSSKNGAHFDTIVDPIWKRLSTDPAARALRELRAASPAWRVFHRVTYVERTPPPVSSQPLSSIGDGIPEPVNLLGSIELLRLIATAIGATPTPTPAQIGAAVAAVLNPAPTAPGKYPRSVLEGIVPWWGAFLARARSGGFVVPEPQAAAELTAIVAAVIDYVGAGYRTGTIPRLLEEEK